MQRRVTSKKHSRCERCERVTQLSKSHAIPDAFFRDLKHGAGGKVTKIHQDFGTRPSAESGWSYILCADCEAHFNTACDEVAIQFVRNSLFEKSPKDYVDHSIIAYFICSVLWRAQLSSASMYNGYKISRSDAAQLSDAALERRDPFQDFSFEVSQLFDEVGSITAGQIRKTIAAPYKAEIKIGSQYHTIHFFVAGGVFFAALNPRVPALIACQRYLVPKGRNAPTTKRALSSLSNFRKIETMARREATRQR